MRQHAIFKVPSIPPETWAALQESQDATEKSTGSFTELVKELSYKMAESLDHIVKAESRPQQRTMFVLGPAPRPTAWVIEWRWKPKLGLDRAWYTHRLFDHRLSTERQAVREAARLRRAFPGKSYRVLPFWATSSVESPL